MSRSTSTSNTAARHVSDCRKRPLRRRRRSFGAARGRNHRAGATRRSAAGRAGHASDRRRARRRMSADIPALSTIKLPWSSDVGSVDISSGGVLVETTSKLVPASSVSLQVLGHGTNLSMPARTVRTKVASVDRLGVRYRVAAAFARELDVFRLDPAPPDASTMPKVMADALAASWRTSTARRPRRSAGNSGRSFAGCCRCATSRFAARPRSRAGRPNRYFTVPAWEGTGRFCRPPSSPAIGGRPQSSGVGSCGQHGRCGAGDCAPRGGA